MWKGGNITPILTRVMLETLNLADLYADIFSFINTSFSTRPTLISTYFGKDNTFVQSNSVRDSLEIFKFCFLFL